jgi:hypothetical protein
LPSIARKNQIIFHVTLEIVRESSIVLIIAGSFRPCLRRTAMHVGASGAMTGKVGSFSVIRPELVGAGQEDRRWVFHV